MHYAFGASRPADSSRLILCHNDRSENRDSLAKSLVNGHDAVLVLDGDSSVVAAEAEVGDNVSPVRLVVTESDCAEYPRAVKLVAVMLGIENTVLCGVVLVDLGILRVEVIDRALELADSGNGIDALPQQMGGVEVCADNGTYSRAEAEECFGIVYAEAGMPITSLIVMKL